VARDAGGNRLPWFKLWAKDFMADPVVQAMTWEQRGRYLWALMCSWESDNPGVSRECEWRAWTGLSEMQWTRARAAFAPAFTIAGETWTQSRLVSVFHEVSGHSEARSRVGRMGAEKRWAKHASAMPQHSLGNASQIQTLRSVSEKPLTPILSRLATSEPAPLEPRESNPIASDPVQVNGKETAEPGRIPPAAYQDGREAFRCTRCGNNAHRRIGEPREVCAQCWALTVETAHRRPTPA
jgi:uncharacterized protein YdaU (DUF1376 family)